MCELTMYSERGLRWDVCELTMYSERGLRWDVCERCEKWANKVSMDFGEGGRCWVAVWFFFRSQLGRRMELLRPRDVDSSGGRQQWDKSISRSQTLPPNTAKLLFGGSGPEPSYKATYI